MRIFLGTILGMTFLMSSRPPQATRSYAYTFLAMESIPTDSHGNVTGAPSWGPINRMKPLPLDTFVFYQNNDSILMITSYVAHPRRVFKKVSIRASRWKPRPSYGKKLIFLGTYEVDDLRGLYFSFYSTKDRSSVLQVHYTNPGNMMAALLFSRDSVNILQNEGVIVDPRDEQKEPDQMDVAQ